MSTKRVPNSELEVLQELWKQPHQTAKQIAESLNDGGKSVSVSSVQTLLRRLEKRKLVRHKTEGKTFLFSATGKPETVRSAHARDFIDRMFGGAAVGFVSQLVDDEELSDREMKDLRDLIDSKLKERKRK